MIVSLLCFGGGVVLGSHFPEKILPVYQSVLGKSKEALKSLKLDEEGA